ncbi:helix-turn-helix domain-containing protein [Cytophagaceae bacterium DM2B3-1]|uniref:Helix-turn-helix domain-containing protein n=1 Tax=Xanthocytophaga flava TaxID=3048013 RepID=A0ABT7CFP6_9BACT|nr:helix-turn-helix domain-containing protein [Xanthocytophaga flavus]MDJ1466546.1 helix-turn-helix domain-containing protein [Xanthocytophaga flavus]MDJ1492543.1 helix-turn-helix domain-containing protein [Xanthocytophaga flavus]
MQPEEESDLLLQPDFTKFFMVKVESMFQRMKLPIPPTKAVAHSLLYLTEGEATMTIGSELYTIRAGECLVVAAGQIFSFSNPDVNKGYLCHFPDDFIVGRFSRKDLLKDFEFLRVWGNPRIQLDSQVSDYVHFLCKRIFTEYIAYGLNRIDILQPYFIALLCELNRSYQPVFSSIHTAALSLTHEFRELLFVHLKTMQLVTDYASLLNISPNHLNKAVKLITGKSPSRWIDEAIVLEAKALLSQSDLSVNEVAAEVGLLDASYFSRLFKRYAGMAPGQFRKMIEKSCN